MRAFSWVPLLGLLAALAAAQDETLTNPDNVNVAQEEATHKQSAPSGILETVQALVASVSPQSSNPSPAGPTNQEGAQLEARPAAQEEGDAAAAGEEEVPPTNQSEPEEPTTILTNREEETSPTSSSNNKENANQVKLVGVYNKVADNVLNILSRSLSGLEPLPIKIRDDVALTALDATEPDTAPEPEPEPETTKEGGKPMTKRDKKKKKKNKNKKNKKNGQMSDAEESERNTNKRNRKNKKGVKNQDQEMEEEVEAQPARKEKKNKNKNKKNKRKNKRKNTKKNKRTNKSEDIETSRRAKAMREEEEAEEEQSPDVEEGRRKAPVKKNKKNKENKKNKKNRKNRKNKKNKNKSNDKNDDQKPESREDAGPVYPSAEERAASNAYLTGLRSISRNGDVMVDRTGKSVLVNVKARVGPVFVQLADAARALTKSHVSTTLEADMQFKIKNKGGRGRQIIKLNSMSMRGPTEVTVARLDMPLEPDVVSTAKDEVRQALDVPRLSRIFEKELEAIFEKDNVVQNLEHHELLQV